MQTILITGAADRLGAYLARHLAHRYKLIIHYHNSAEKAESIAKELGAVLWQADLSDSTIQPPACEILINNAAVFESDNLTTISLDSFQKHMQLNCFAAINLIQQLKPQHTINIIDAKVKRLSPGFLSYTLSKAGLAAFTEIAALELAPKCRVNAIAPAAVIPTPTQSDQHFKKMQQHTPLNGAKVEDILSAVDYLLGTTSVTGQTLFVDAGATVGNGGLAASC